MRQLNRQAVTEIGIARRLSDAKVVGFSDRRDRRGRRYPWPALVTTLMLGCVAGLPSLREVEAMSACLRSSVRRRTKIAGRISDTKLRDVLLDLDPDETHAALVRQVKAEHRRRTLKPEVLPIGLAAIDGKHLAKLESWDHPDVQAVRPTHNPPYGLARVHRAHLVSSSACVCLGQRPIPGETNEIGAVCDFTRQLLSDYAHTDLIEAFMVDAGNASLEHADLIHGAERGYIFTIKQPAGDLYDEAVRLLGELPPEQAEATRTTREKGARVTVRLWRTSLRGYLRWKHARQLLRVERTVERGQQSSTGVRYFVTNLVPGRLSAKHWLTAVRMYWRCENEGHWTADVVWKEDARRTPWTRQARAVYALASLRMLALNILAVLRRISRREWESRPLPWREATRLAYSALATPTTTTGVRFSCD
jgi:predicted transposase YbfD/YdcC